MRGFLIDVTSNKIKEVDANGLDDYYKLIGCRCVDIAVREVGGRAYNIVLDDEGLLVNNPIISAYMGNEPALAGNFIFFGIEDDTFELAPMTDADVDNIRKHTKAAFGLMDGKPVVWPVVVMDAVKW